MTRNVAPHKDSYITALQKISKMHLKMGEQQTS